MTAKEKEEVTIFMKKNSISITTLITLISFVFYIGFGHAEMQNKIDAFKDHTDNEDLHMTYHRASTIYVPRTEIEFRLKSIENMIKDNRQMLMRIEDRIE